MKHSWEVHTAIQQPQHLTHSSVINWSWLNKDILISLRLSSVFIRLVLSGWQFKNFWMLKNYIYIYKCTFKSKWDFLKVRNTEELQGGGRKIFNLSEGILIKMLSKFPVTIFHLHLLLTSINSSCPTLPCSDILSCPLQSWPSLTP